MPGATTLDRIIVAAIGCSSPLSPSAAMSVLVTPALANDATGPGMTTARAGHKGEDDDDDDTGTGMEPTVVPAPRTLPRTAKRARPAGTGKSNSKSKTRRARRLGADSNSNSKTGTTRGTGKSNSKSNTSWGKSNEDRAMAAPPPLRPRGRARNWPRATRSPRRSALKRLGGGPRYDAYLAWDERQHAVVVCKVVRPHLVETPRTLAGLAGEWEMLERLDQPVIVRGFDAVLDGPRPHLVLEHLEGPRLSTLVRRYGPLPVEQLVPMALELCSAIHYLRAEEVVHLDVEPSNTIMGAPPRLIDLSVALTSRTRPSLSSPIGTDAYMAPEQCDPQRLGPVGRPRTSGASG